MRVKKASNAANCCAGRDILTVRVFMRRPAAQFCRRARRIRSANALRAQHLLQTEVALQQLDIAPFDLSAAVEFDRLDKAGLSRKIGRADLLVASIALAQRATLVTRNVRHFRQVPGLQLENWME
ncbi:MAG: type II toxin-antitoxin system VapC family toxin [Aquincola sp.]|nr:type II toxin-antitoxin system VapC family toxin [Aquincola sp.]